MKALLEALDAKAIALDERSIRHRPRFNKNRDIVGASLFVGNEADS